jgi:hypothetical protein
MISVAAWQERSPVAANAARATQSLSGCGVALSDLASIGMR